MKSETSDTAVEFVPERSRRVNVETGDEDSATAFEKLAKYLSYTVVILLLPLSLFFCLKIAYEFQRVIVFRLGRLRKGERGPGVFFILPCIDDMFYIDLRTECISVFPQEVLTKDSVSIKLDAVIYFRIEDATRAVVQVDNYRYSTLLLAKSILRNVAGTKVLLEFLGHREEVAHSLQQLLDQATDIWGVKVERVEIKDVRLPLVMQRSMAAEAEANREAKAIIIAAEGEKLAADALKQASNIMTSSPAAVQLRYLQTLQTISAFNNSTIILPFPRELGKKWINLASDISCHCDV